MNEFESKMLEELQQLRNELRELKSDVKGLYEAFPNRDPIKHRIDHEQQNAIAAEKGALKLKIVATYWERGLLVVLGILAYALKDYIEYKTGLRITK